MAARAKLNRVCLCLNSATLAENLACLQAEKYFDPALDLAELRLDFMLDFSSSSVLEKSLQKLCHDLGNYRSAVPLQFVLTLRKASDGGRCPDSMADSDYLAILQRCLSAFLQPIYMDLDAPLLQRINSHGALSSFLGGLRGAELQQGKRVQLIASVHDFGPLPSIEELRSLFAELEQLLLRLPRNTLLKFALMVNSSEELLRFYQFALNLKGSNDRAYILLAMGEFGSSSRVLRAHIGSEWTFCRAKEPTAPGQFQLDELVELYRYRSISEETLIYGVVGNPIEHSRSPEIHNPIYQQRGWDAVYLRFRVDDLRPFLALSELLSIRGISCTTPHKEALAEIAISSAGVGSACVSEAVRVLGASNTFYLQTDGNWFAENTDIEGFLQPLLDFCIRHEFSLKGKKAVIIGAGGAARAAVYAFLSQSVDCEIYNRTLRRAEKLQALFPIHLPGKVLKAARLEQGCHIPANCDLLIQATSVGMGYSDPIPAYSFRPGQIAYDLIYRPQLTVFLRRAQHAGALVLNGSAMLKKQALAQIELFSGPNRFRHFKSRGCSPPPISNWQTL